MKIIKLKEQKKFSRNDNQIDIGEPERIPKLTLSNKIYDLFYKLLRQKKIVENRRELWFNYKGGNKNIKEDLCISYSMALYKLYYIQCDFNELNSLI